MKKKSRIPTKTLAITPRNIVDLIMNLMDKRDAYKASNAHRDHVSWQDEIDRDFENLCQTENQLEEALKEILNKP